MGADLLQLYEKSGLSLSEVAKSSGVSLSTVQRYIKNDKKNMKETYFNAILKVLEEVNGNNSKLKVTDNSDQIIQTKSENHYEHRSFKRGEIYYIKGTTSTGGEIFGTRPAVILSSDKLNQIMNTVEIMYITGSPKQELPTHCTISTDRELSVVLGEQISTVAKSRIGNYLETVSSCEMSVIERIALISLGIKVNNVDVKHSTDYIILQAEKNKLEDFQNKLMSILLK